MAKKTPKTNHRQEDSVVRRLDELSEFEDFRDRILPAIRKDMASGMTAEEIRQKWLDITAGEEVTIALTAEDPRVRLQAIKNIADRVEGKARETKEVTHRMKDIPEEQLDALILSELEDTEEYLEQ